MDRFADCLSKGRLKKVEVDPQWIARELRSALLELERAHRGRDKAHWEEAATQGYFSLYRAAHAALLSKGYLDLNIYGLCVGIEHLFVEAGQLPSEIVIHLRDGKDIKDTVYSRQKSTSPEVEQVLEWAVSGVARIVALLAATGIDVPQIAPPPRGGESGLAGRQEQAE